MGRYFTSSGDATGDVFVIAASVSMHMTALIGPVPAYGITAVTGGFVAVYQVDGSDGTEVYEQAFSAPSLP